MKTPHRIRLKLTLQTRFTVNCLRQNKRSTYCIKRFKFPGKEIYNRIIMVEAKKAFTKLILLGEVGVGKTSLINKFAKDVDVRHWVVAHWISK